MAARKLDQWVSALHRAGEDSLPLVLEALAVRTGAFGVIVAAAAKPVREYRMTRAVPALVAAFEALLGDDAAKRDPGCAGKIAVAGTLHELDHWDDTVFAVGARTVQIERTPISSEDTAIVLRGVCGLAYAHFARADALDVLADLLADEHPLVRKQAAQGLGDGGRPDAGAMLRYKLRAGSDDPDVLATCFESMLALGRSAAVPFAIEMLACPDERAESAALALGSARIADATEALIAWSRAGTSARKKIGYLVLALLRSERANAELVTVLRGKVRDDAIAAAEALATFKHEPAIAAHLEAAQREVKDRAVRDAIAALLR